MWVNTDTVYLSYSEDSHKNVIDTVKNESFRQSNVRTDVWYVVLFIALLSIFFSTLVLGELCLRASHIFLSFEALRIQEAN